MYALKLPELDLSIYSNQLQHENWIIKRNEILYRDNNECQLCFSRNELQIHHKIYLKGHKAWEYPNNYLITLCSQCHELFENDKIKNGRDKPEINKNRLKDSNLYKRVYETDFSQRERKIINYIAINSRHGKYTIKLDAERLHTNKRSISIGLEKLLKCKLIFETDKPNIYKFNTVHFGA